MIKYREGYKYCLAETYTYQTAIFPDDHVVIDDFITLTATGLLIINKGYAWDGPSGPTIDTKNFMRGSLVHDALYQLMREGLLDKKWFKQANEELHSICIADGMSWFRARYVKLGVDMFGQYALDPNENKIVEAP